jgi:hypothetical protein
MQAVFTARFSPRQEVLVPVAAAACGMAARALAERLLRCKDEQLVTLRGAAGRDVLIVTGEAEALPWVDGAVYLGRDPLAPRLLIPAMMQPNIAPDAFERAIARHAAALTPPWAVLIDPPRVFSAAHASAMDRGYIQRWLEIAP